MFHNFGNDSGQIVSELPCREVTPEFRQVGDVANMVAGPVLVHVNIFRRRAMAHLDSVSGHVLYQFYITHKMRTASIAVTLLKRSLPSVLLRGSLHGAQPRKFRLQCSAGFQNRPGQ